MQWGAFNCTNLIQLGSRCRGLQQKKNAPLIIQASVNPHQNFLGPKVLGAIYRDVSGIGAHTHLFYIWIIVMM